MPHFHVTIRYGTPRQQYHVEYVDASSLRDALRLAAESFPESAVATADLVEIRRQVDPDAREYAPG